MDLGVDGGIRKGEKREGGRREARNGGRPGLAQLVVRRGSRIGAARESARLAVRCKSRFGTARGSAQLAARRKLRNEPRKPFRMADSPAPSRFRGSFLKCPENESNELILLLAVLISNFG